VGGGFLRRARLEGALEKMIRGNFISAPASNGGGATRFFSEGEMDPVGLTGKKKERKPTMGRTSVPGSIMEENKLGPAVYYRAMFSGES